jgi:hypothetical protein
MDNPYLVLTRELNEGRLRALLSSGQAGWCTGWPS